MKNLQNLPYEGLLLEGRQNNLKVAGSSKALVYGYYRCKIWLCYAKLEHKYYASVARKPFLELMAGKIWINGRLRISREIGTFTVF